MRDIVSENGSFFSGLSALPVVKTTQTSPSVPLTGFDGAMVYILANNWTDGTMTPVIQVAPDVSGAPGTWAAAPAADLVAWSATSATNSNPLRLGYAQPNAISSVATAINQRVGYIGGADWLRVVSTVTGSPATGTGYDVIINLGRPRIMPSQV